MKTFLFLAAICWPSFNFAQNLVPNPGFEDYTTCPTNLSQVYYAEPWFQPCAYMSMEASCSSDLYNACAPSAAHCSVPDSPEGTQAAHSGNGYAGIYCFIPGGFSTEFLEVELLSPLVHNQQYCVEFYVSLGDICQTAISDIGVYFSADSLVDHAEWCFGVVGTLPQFENPDSAILSDRTNWMLVSGIYTAAGGEKFMTLGNFEASADVHYELLDGSTSPTLAYYFFDDISVSPCIVTTVAKEANDLVELNVFPNPSEEDITLEYILGNRSAYIYFTNPAGQHVATYDLVNHQGKLVIKKGELSKGIYIYNLVTSDGQVYNGRLVVLK